MTKSPSELPRLDIDLKWSVEYDPENNDRPTRLFRYGEPVFMGTASWTNEVVAMFYALMEARHEANQ
jgi:hypothetical protein